MVCPVYLSPCLIFLFFWERPRIPGKRLAFRIGKREVCPTSMGARSKTTKRDYEAFSPEKLLRSADTLFYTRGYSVGLAEILESADIYKATFYKYYESKEDLAAVYIAHKRDELAAMLRHLMEKKPVPQDFFKSWVRLLEKGSRSNQFYGCPFSNMFSQTLAESPRLTKDLSRAVESILDTLADYFEAAQRRGHISGSSRRIAVRAFTLYEGAMAMFNLTRDGTTFKYLEEDLLALLG